MAKKGANKKDAKKPREGDDADDSEGKGGKGKLIIIIVAVLLVVGGGGGVAAFFFLGGSEEESGEVATADGALPTELDKGEPRYVDLDPDFTVNMEIGDSRRFVQVAISLLTYFDETEEAIKDNLPIIRNNIILMIGRKSSNELATLEGKNSLQQEIYEEVISVLEENSAGTPIDIDRVYFTKFVMQ